MSTPGPTTGHSQAPGPHQVNFVQLHEAPHSKTLLTLQSSLDKRYVLLLYETQALVYTMKEGTLRSIFNYTEKKKNSKT